MSYKRGFVVYANWRHWLRHSLERAKPFGVALWPLFKPQWWAKQRLAGEGRRYYGDGGTIHGTQHLDIETNGAGRVVAVWFRCQALPFKQHIVDPQRAASMANITCPALTGVEVES